MSRWVTLRESVGSENTAHIIFVELSLEITFFIITFATASAYCSDDVL